MTRLCTICKHKKKEQINDRLINKAVSGESYKKIADDFKCSESVIWHHANNCITELVSRSKNIANSIGPESLKCQLQKHEAKIQELMERALDSNDIRTARLFMTDALAAMRFKAELEGKIHDREVTINMQVNILNSPEWIELRGKIFKAIAPYPEAMKAISEVL